MWRLLFLVCALLNVICNIPTVVSHPLAQRGLAPSDVKVNFVNYKNDDDFQRIVQHIISLYDGQSENFGNIKAPSAPKQIAVAVPNPITNNRPAFRAPSAPTLYQMVLPQQQAHIVDSKPVDKNYAINFLPKGIDVVPGSSYIPLRKR